MLLFHLLRSALRSLRAVAKPFEMALFLCPRPAHAAGTWPINPPVSRGGSPADAGAPGRVMVTGPVFRGLTLATVLSVFALVVLGGVVRLTDSGLGCPDWPLCSGNIIPPLETHALVEYSHRLMASVVGLLVFAVAFGVWRSYRGQPWLMVPATLGVFLLVVQVLLGGFTVLTDLSSEMVLVHLATAEALMASMVVVMMVALFGPPGLVLQVDGERRDWLSMLSLGALVAVYGLLLTGSYVTVSGSTAACGVSWPDCQGQIFPEGHHAAMHMVHRVGALLVGVLILGVLAMAWRRRGERPSLGWAAVLVGGVFLAQVMVGAATVWLAFPLSGRLLHLAMATLVWVGLVALAVLSYNVSEPRLGDVGRA